MKTTFEKLVAFFQRKSVRTFIKCELIVAAICFAIVFGFKAYIEYEPELSPEEKAEMAAMDKAVREIAKQAEEMAKAELERKKAEVAQCVAVCRTYRAVFDAALGSDEEFYLQVMNQHIAEHADDPEALHGIVVAGLLGISLKDAPETLARFNAWLDGAEIQL